MNEHSFNVTISAQINKSDIEDDSELSCLVRIPNTEYERRESVTYDGMINCCYLTHNSEIFISLILLKMSFVWHHFFLISKKCSVFLRFLLKTLKHMSINAQYTTSVTHNHRENCKYYTYKNMF